LKRRSQHATGLNFIQRYQTYFAAIVIRTATDRGPAHRARRFDSGEYPVAISSKLAATCGS
jgi:hypothetical protein